MASLWQKTLFYLGLVDETQADQTDPIAVDPGTPAMQPTDTRTVHPARTGAAPVRGRRVEPPAVARRRMAADPTLAEAGVYVPERDERHDTATVRPTAPSAPESEVIVAKAFADAQRLADYIRSRTPVVLDLRTTEPEMVRRLVDFSSGLTYALDGSMRKVAQGVILVSPPRVSLSTEERRRLSDLGLYEAPDLG